MRSGTPLARLRERQRRAVAPERVAYARERGLEYSVEQVEVVAEQAAADVATAQAQIDDEIVPQVAGVTETVQIAQTSTNDTQAEVDTLSGSGAVSGSASNPAVDVSDGTWVLGPQVDLAGVAAGDLTITGSGPLQDSDVSVTGGSFAGQFRVVEVVSGVDEVLNTWSFTVSSAGVVSTLHSGSVADYVSARTSTGAVSYRIDARRASGTGQVSSLSLYMHARRAP